MELEEAKKICQDFIDENKNRRIILHTAIETIVQALENKDIEIHKLKQSNAEKTFRINEQYIPKKKIEDKIKELKKCKMDIVQSPVHNVNEKMKILDRNMIKREVLQELLEEK